MATESHKPARPLLIGYDGSEPAATAVTAAARLFPGSSAIVACAWSRPVLSDGFGMAYTYSVPPDIQEKAAETAAAAARDTASAGAQIARQGGLVAEPLAIEASAGVWAALLAAAEERDAAAIVVGSRGHGRMRSALLGSVSAGIVHHAGRPVLVVPPPAIPGRISQFLRRDKGVEVRSAS
jgi:nucleotide-binding universal stress UspA family protein